MLSRIILMTFISLSMIPGIANASSCTNFIKQVQMNVKSHPEGNAFPWPALSDFQKILGQGSKVSTSETTTSYQWICLDNNSVNITAVVTQEDKIAKVYGFYSNGNGDEFFSADITDVMTSPIMQPMQSTQSISTGAQSQKSSTCQTIFNQIKNEYKAGMNIAWLKDKLGTPHMTTIPETLSVWDNYAVYTADHSTSRLGTPPNGAPPYADLADIIKVLGQPKHTYTDTLYKYVWSCPNAYTLSVNAGKQGNMVQIVYGQTASNSEALVDMSSTNPTELYTKFKTVLTADTKQATPSSSKLSFEEEALLQMYNEFFNTSFTSIAQVEADSLDKEKVFFAAIRSCTPGTYKHLDVEGMATSLITGIQNGSCVFNTTVTIPGITTGKTVQCKLSAASMAAFTDNEAEVLIKSSDKTGNTQSTTVQKILKAECQ